uniref:Uncharacterized protein n=1 Tax=viral metagenome TaxID=1070528 RepID=A0A6C0F5N8_9ZZZZ
MKNKNFVKQENKNKIETVLKCMINCTNIQLTMSPQEVIVYTLAFVVLFPALWQFTIMAIFLTVRRIYG